MAKRGAGEGSIKKRKDGRYEASVRVGVIDGKLIRKSVYGKTRAGVQEKLDALRRDVSKGNVVAVDGQSLGDFLDYWLENIIKIKRKPKTHHSYAQLVRLHIKPALGTEKLQKLTAEKVQSFLNGRLSAGLSARTVDYIRGVLRSALNHALRRDKVARNVVLLTEPPRQVRFQVEPLSREHAKAFLKAIRGHRLEALFHVAFRGLRQGEVLGLRWMDVDFASKVLHVRVALQNLGGKFELVEPKTANSRRSIPLDNKLVAQLKKRRAAQGEERLLAGEDWKDWGLVFTTRGGRPLEGPRITRDFKKLLTDAKLPRQRFHDLRHACATFMLADGMSPHEVKEWLGHSQISLTLNTYAHVLPEARRDVANRLAKLLA